MAHLTNAQKATLKAFILADPVLSTKVSGPGTDYAFISVALNADAPGPVKAWRDSITQIEMVEASVDQVAAFDNLTAGKRSAWSDIFLKLQTFDFTRNKIRSAAGKVWAATERDAILNAVGLENASVAENAIGGTNVTEGTVTAMKRNFIGDIDIPHVAEILS